MHEAGELGVGPMGLGATGGAGGSLLRRLTLV